MYLLPQLPSLADTENESINKDSHNAISILDSESEEANAIIISDDDSEESGTILQSTDAIISEFDDSPDLPKQADNSEEEDPNFRVRDSEAMQTFGMKEMETLRTLVESITPNDSGVLKIKKDRPIKKSSKLEDCEEPTSAFYVRLSRFSRCQNWNAARWHAWIATERARTLVFVNTFNPAATLEDIVVIVIQRTALGNLNMLEDIRCDDTLPPTSRPSHLRTLRQQNAIRALILSNPDQFFADMNTLARFLLGMFDNLSHPCIPTFDIHIHALHKTHFTTSETIIPARELVAAVREPENKASAAVTRFLDLSLRAEGKRVLQSLSSTLSSAGRNKASGHSEIGTLTIANIPRIISYLHNTMGVDTTYYTDAAATAIQSSSSKETKVSAVTKVKKKHYRLIRYSHWRQWLPRKDKAAFVEAQRAAHAKVLGKAWKGVKPEDVEVIVFGHSALSRLDILARASSFPMNAMNEFLTAVSSNAVASLSLTSPDGLTTHPGDLASFLRSLSSESDVPMYIWGGTYRTWETTASRLARSLETGIDTAPDSREYITFKRHIYSGLVSRLAQVMASRIGGGSGRNRQVARQNEIAPSSAYRVIHDSMGRVRYKCTMKNEEGHECDYDTGDGPARDQHYVTEIDARPHACPICGNSFNDASSLHRHQRYQHPEPKKQAAVKKFVCTVCKHETHRKDHLDLHMRKHTKQHTCGTCGEVYKGSRALAAHTKTHSKKEQREAQKRRLAEAKRKRAEESADSASTGQEADNEAREEEDTESTDASSNPTAKKARKQ